MPRQPGFSLILSYIHIPWDSISVSVLYHVILVPRCLRIEVFDIPNTQKKSFFDIFLNGGVGNSNLVFSTS